MKDMMAIMARRPLLSSLVCISLSSAASVGLRPSGSKPKSPASWSDLIAQPSMFGFSKDCALDQMKLYREAEVTHGRVAMLATLGFLVGESFHPLFGLDGKEILAIDSLTEVRQVFPAFFEILVILIGAIELSRAQEGWVPPSARGSGGNEGDFLNVDYYPGDIGFDPLGLKPTDAEEFAAMQTKELQNGRLAMLAIAGFVAQELVDHKPILLNDFGI